MKISQNPWWRDMDGKKFIRRVRRFRRFTKAYNSGKSLEEAKQEMDYVPIDELAEILEVDEEEIMGWIEDGTVDPKYVRVVKSGK